MQNTNTTDQIFYWVLPFLSLRQIFTYFQQDKNKHFIPIILFINVYILFAFLSISLHLLYTESVNIQANVPC